MRDKRRKKHHGLLALIIIVAVMGTCVAAADTETGNRKIAEIAGKKNARRVERVLDKTRQAASELGRSFSKAGDLLDRLVQKAGGKEEIAKKVRKIISQFTRKSSLKKTDDIDLMAVDNIGYAYRFTYGGDKYRAVYSASYDTWTVYDSYKITNEHDIRIICQALIDVHPVHGSDLKSYRTADDMAYEWKQHNIVYELLPDGNRYKQMAKNVDLDPYDQGRSYKEIYEDRTGKKFDIKDFV